MLLLVKNPSMTDRKRGPTTCQVLCRVSCEIPMLSLQCMYHIHIQMGKWDLEKRRDLPSITQFLGVTSPHHTVILISFRHNQRQDQWALQVFLDQPQPPLTVSLQGSPSSPLIRGWFLPLPRLSSRSPGTSPSSSLTLGQAGVKKWWTKETRISKSSLMAPAWHEDPKLARRCPPHNGRHVSVAVSGGNAT